MTASVETWEVRARRPRLPVHGVQNNGSGFIDVFGNQNLPGGSVQPGDLQQRRHVCVQTHTHIEEVNAGRRHTSMRSVPVSVQYRFLATQSTAMPSGCLSSVVTNVAEAFPSMWARRMALISSSVQ